jgi:hypothetical protein
MYHADLKLSRSTGIRCYAELISNQAAVLAFAAVLRWSQTKPQYRHSLLCCADLKPSRSTGIRCCAVQISNQAAVPAFAVVLTSNCTFIQKFCFFSKDFHKIHWFSYDLRSYTARGLKIFLIQLYFYGFQVKKFFVRFKFISKAKLKFSFKQEFSKYISLNYLQN